MHIAAGDSIDLQPLAAVALAAVGCALGCVARDLTVGRFRARMDRADLGVLAANLAACVLAGLASSAGGALGHLLVAGVAGGLSTWSTLAVEVAGAIRARRWSLVALHVPGACALALAAYVAARALAGGGS